MVDPNSPHFTFLLNSSYETVIDLCTNIADLSPICDSPYLWARKAELDFNITPEDLELVPGDNNFIKYTWIMNLDPNEGLIQASEINNLSLAKYFISQGANSFNSAIFIASEQGYLPLVKLLVKKDNVDGAICLAAENGHVNVVSFLLKYGANDYNNIMICAIEGNQIDIVKLMINLGADEYDRGMIEAARNGYLDIVKLMIKKGAKDFDGTMLMASKYGHLNIVKLMIDHGADNFNDGMLAAAFVGDPEILRLMLDHGANNYEDAIEQAYLKDHYEIIDIIKQYIEGQRLYDQFLLESGRF